MGVLGIYESSWPKESPLATRHVHANIGSLGLSVLDSMGECREHQSKNEIKQKGGRRMGEVDQLPCIEREEKSRKTQGNITGTRLRELLIKQEYRCALTGRPLTPETAGVDHIVPLSRGGTHTIDNLWIVLRDVNRMKGTMTGAEFIDLCREVSSRATGPS